MHDKGWIHADASAVILYKPESFPSGQGISITAVNIMNTSHEVLYVESVWVDVASKGIEDYQSILAYPPGHPILSSPGYGDVAPGEMSRRILLENALVPPGESVIVSIAVRSESGRWGVLTQEVQP